MKGRCKKMNKILNALNSSAHAIVDKYNCVPRALRFLLSARFQPCVEEKEIKSAIFPDVLPFFFSLLYVARQLVGA